MAWFSGRVSLGNFPDLAGAVNKLQESVKNIEKNFDSALGFEETSQSSNEDKAAQGIWPSATDRKALFDPVMALMGQKSEESATESDEPESSEILTTVEASEKQESPRDLNTLEGKEGSEVETSVRSASEEAAAEDDKGDKIEKHNVLSETAKEQTVTSEPEKVGHELLSVSVEAPDLTVQHVGESDSADYPQKIGDSENRTSENTELVQEKSIAIEVDPVEGTTTKPDESHEIFDSHENMDGKKTQQESSDAEMTVLGTNDVQKTEVVSAKEQKKQIEISEERRTLIDSTEEQKTQVGSFEEQKTSADEQKTEVESTDEQKTLINKVHKTEIESAVEQKTEAEDALQKMYLDQTDAMREAEGEVMLHTFSSHSRNIEENQSAHEFPSSHLPPTPPSDEALKTISRVDSHENDTKDETAEAGQEANESETEAQARSLSSGTNVLHSSNSVVELEKVKMEMKMMEAALQGAARQAQAKADEIAKLMNENEHLKSVVEDLKRKSNDAEVESLREEYHQRVATLERKVYALTKERDTLRREQNKKSDAAVLLKEKDEIISQVMAEGEELSKKQAAQESQIRKLRAQIRELEEEKKGFITKLQVEENKVESIKRDKTATEKLLQESIEKHQAELSAQKEYYTNALNAAKEAKTLAEARVNNEARAELESRLREAEEREAMLVQSLEELRQTLSRKEQQAVFREDMLRRDIEDLQQRYQASERRCEELITQVPESTRPLLRQIEAMQETTARRAEAWAAVERSLNSRLQEAEARAAASEEKERSVNERLSQTLSRINVLEAQISCLRAEQMQLSRSLEKERQRAAEIRREVLTAKEEADAQEGRVKQLEDEMRELRLKHKQELQDALMQKEQLQQEIEREKSARMELEKTARLHSTAISDHGSVMRQSSGFENGILTRKISSASSIGSMEESYYLQASLDDSSDKASERRNVEEPTMSPYYMKTMTSSSYGAALRQKEGELASYISRLQSMEAIRDSLAEELVKMTEQCEKLRAEAAVLPGIQAELDALRRRHSAALELMGERDEELEELRADIIDMKEMYREQVNMLVNQIQRLNPSVTAS